MPTARRTRRTTWTQLGKEIAGGVASPPTAGPATPSTPPSADGPRPPCGSRPTGRGSDRWGRQLHLPRRDHALHRADPSCRFESGEEVCDPAEKEADEIPDLQHRAHLLSFERRSRVAHTGTNKQRQPRVKRHSAIAERRDRPPLVRGTRGRAPPGPTPMWRAPPSARSKCGRVTATRRARSCRRPCRSSDSTRSFARRRVHRASRRPTSASPRVLAPLRARRRIRRQRGRQRLGGSGRRRSFSARASRGTPAVSRWQTGPDRSCDGSRPRGREPTGWRPGGRGGPR